MYPAELRFKRNVPPLPVGLICAYYGILHGLDSLPRTNSRGVGTKPVAASMPRVMCGQAGENVDDRWISLKAKSKFVWRCLLLVAALYAPLYAPLIPAANVAGLYDVIVPPSEKPGQSSFDEALRQVAVRVTGLRDGGDRLAATKPNARGPLKQFSFQPDGSAAVGFDGNAFEKLIINANLPIWGRERPAVLIWLSLPDASGRAVWQSVNDKTPERELLQRIGLARGLPLIWPTMDATDLGVASGLATSGRSYAQLLASGERYRADAVLFGVGTRDASGAVSVRWSFAFNDEVMDTQSTVDEGVHFAADRCARVLAIAPGARAVVPVSVTGIRDLDAYARAVNYLEGITLVIAGGVAVDQLRGEDLDLRLTVRGDATALRRTIGLGRRFVEVKSSEPAMSDRLVLRLAQ